MFSFFREVLIEAITIFNIYSLFVCKILISKSNSGYNSFKISRKYIVSSHYSATILNLFLKSFADLA